MPDGPERPKPDRPDFDRPGFNDLVTPFIFVPHGAPDPVAWKQPTQAGSVPATFISHKKPGRRYTVINGRRWPLDKRGQPCRLRRHASGGSLRDGRAAASASRCARWTSSRPVFRPLARRASGLRRSKQRFKTR